MIKTDTKEKEQILLGSILHDNSHFELIEQILNEDDFSNQNHQKIFRAYKRIIQQDKPIDILTTHEELQKQNYHTVTSTYLAELERAYFPGIEKNLEHHARELKKLVINNRVRQKLLEFTERELEDPLILSEKFKKEIENITSDYSPGSFISNNSLKLEHIQDRVVEYLIPDFLPLRSLSLITAKYAGGKSLFCYALIKLAIQSGMKAIYIDQDMNLDSVSERLKDAGLNEHIDKNLWYLHRHQCEIKVGKRNWKPFLDEMRNKEPHIIVLDNIKDLSTGRSDLDKDTDAIMFMDQIKKLRDFGHTVILLHHVSKDAAATIPSKNSGTIIDESDVAYHLKYDDKEKMFHFKCFKDRMRVRKDISFRFYEDFSIEECVNPDVELIKTAIEKHWDDYDQGPNQSQIVRSVEEYIGKNKAVTILNDGEGIHWYCKKGLNNSRIYSVSPFPPYIYTGKPGNPTEEDVNVL